MKRRLFKKRRAGISAIELGRMIGRAMIDGLQAGSEIYKVSRNLSEKEIEGFENELKGLPTMLYEPAKVTKWDVIARLQYLRNLLRNEQEKNFGLLERYNHLKLRHEELEHEYDKLEAEIDFKESRDTNG